jgi:hypothetical protein
VIPKQVLAALLSIAVFGFGVLFVLSEMYLGAGEGLLDGRLGGYSVDDVAVYLGFLTPDARAFYLGTFRLLDTVIPLLIAVALAAIIWSYSARVLRVLAVLPFIYLGFDWYENALVAQIVTAGLKELDADLIARASLMTSAKWLFMLVSLGAAILGWRKARAA